MTRPRRHALVVGAGIFGVAAARALAARRWAVTLLDPGPIPHPHASSTDRSKVVRMDYGRDAFITGLAQDARDGWLRWNRDVFSRPLYHEVGFTLLSRDPLAAGGYEFESLRALEALGHPVERLDRTALRRRFPAWNADLLADGYLSAHAGWVESGEAVRQLAASAAVEGVTTREATVSELVEEGSAVVGVRTTSGEEVRADAVVVAAGAWTPRLLPWLAPELRPTPMPVLLFRPADPAAFRPPRFLVWGADIARTGWYGFPAGDDGLIKIGHHGAGAEGDPDAPRALPPAWEARARAFLADALPSLAHAPLAETRVCFYCDARDGHFWIAGDPERPGLVVASGGSGHGFKFGPVLGELVVAAVEGEDDRRLRRFRWRPGVPPGREDARASEV